MKIEAVGEQLETLNLESRAARLQELSLTMLYSYSFKNVLDFMTVQELLKMQQINRFLYDELIP